MTPAGFPHSEIHGSMPACGSPWLFAAYHVFLRRPVPWHPPCALSNLIVTSEQLVKVSFQVFESLYPETNCKIVFRNWFLYKMFSIWLCSFQGTSAISRSLKTIHPQEERSVNPPESPPDFLRLFGFSQTLSRLHRPGMNDPVPLLVLSLERR